MAHYEWEPTHLDFTLSLYTGLTRASWIDAAKHFLKGIFSNIKDFDSPVIMPRCETEVSYPNKESPAHKVQAEYFEGLARSFFLAAPLLHIEPDLEICGFRLKDYYKAHVLKACTAADPLWVFDIQHMKEIEKKSGGAQSAAFQQTVETAALVICLWVCKEVIWDTYTKKEKKRIADFIGGYAHEKTIPHNWRLFNMLDMAFLHMEGYSIDKDIMRDHAQTILNYYAGDGWYRDGHSFDYYSCWAFNLYTALWNRWYGYKNEPYLASRFEENANCLMQTYPDFFDKDGWTNMWGRSTIYRNAATSPLAGNFFFAHSEADPGLARRICSGSLLQFITRKDLWYKGVPVLGFYGPFVPMVQNYSCAESPFWLAKAFLCLYLPENHPFWTAKENNGSWETLEKRGTKVTALNAPALCFSNHQANGTTELRTGKVIKAQNNTNGLWNYAKLCYNTKFPWEASNKKDMESQQYVLYDKTSDTYSRANALLWSGERQEVLYRRSFFGFTDTKEELWMPAIDLADFVVPYGIFRADKMRFFQKPLSLTLGAYGFPDNGTEITYKTKGDAKAVILKGCDRLGKPRQLAFTVFAGWDGIGIKRSAHTNADSIKSIVPYAYLKRKRQYGYEPYMLMSQVLTKTDDTDFTDADLFPLKAIRYTDKEKCGGYGPVTLVFKNGTQRIIDFSGMEGNLSL